MSFLYKLHKLYKSYLWTETERELFSLFASPVVKPKNKSTDLILIQCVENYFYYSLFGQITSDLQKTKKIQVEQYILRNFSVGSYESIQRFVKSKFHINRIKDRKWTRLYGSFCHGVAYSNEQGLGVTNDFSLFFKAKKIAKTLTFKNDIVALKYEDILIGDLIYDTYLRFKPAPTVDLEDFYLVIVIWKAIRNVHIAKKYFSEKTPKVLLQSYSTYIQHGITARVALQNDTDVYIFHGHLSMVKKISPEDHSHFPSTVEYKNEFEILLDKDIKRLEAERELANRLSGKVDQATAYMKESAYKESEHDLPDVQGAVVVFLHDFYDAPHVYRSMVFADFWDWIEFTINELEKKSLNYYLKPHPNQLPESGDVVTKLCKRHPNVKLLSAKITNKQLVAGGIKLGITVYGTVAHELVYMGIPIITCGDNPHSSYGFCFEAKNKEQYQQLIGDINSLATTNMAQFKEDIESFYYMHNLNKSAEEIELLDKLSLLRRMSPQLVEIGNLKEYSQVLGYIKNNNQYKEFVNNL